MVAKLVEGVGNCFHRAAEFFQAASYVHFQEAIRAIARERLDRSAQYLRFETLDIHEENIGRSKSTREFVNADAGHCDFSPCARAVIDLSIATAIEFNRVQVVGHRRMDDGDVTGFVQAAIPDSGFIIVRTRFDCDHLSCRADKFGHDHRDDALMRAAIEHSRAWTQAMLRQERHLGGDFGRIAVVPAFRGRIRNPQIEWVSCPRPAHLVRPESTERPAVRRYPDLVCDGLRKHQFGSAPEIHTCASLSHWLETSASIACPHRASYLLGRHAEIARSIPGTRLLLLAEGPYSSDAKHRSIRLGVGATLDHLPFRTQSLDLITLNNVAEHLERPREVLAEFARVLAPGGRVIIHTPNVESYAVRIAEVGRRILPKPFIMKLIRYMDFREEEDVFPTYYRVNTRADLLAAAGASGLTSENVILAPARPLFYFVAPLCAAELAASRLMLRMGADSFAASVIIGMFRKPA